MAITLVIFIVLRIIPGDILIAFYGTNEVSRITPQQREALMEALGLDRPLYIQYLGWLKDLATLELGKSFFRTDTVADVLKRRAPLSLELAVGSTILSWIIGFPVGLIGALKRNSVADYVTRVGTILFLAIPGFWLGLLLVIFMAVQFGYASPIASVQLWEDPKQNLQIVWAPILMMGIGGATYIARMTRSSLLEVIGQDYIRTARAKGLVERITIMRHAVKNAILPVLTISGIILGFLLGGSVAMEKVFNVRGLGEILIRAIAERDVVMIQNLVLLYGIIFTITNFAVDIMYGWLDPRIRYS